MARYRELRGNTFEEEINITNERYMQKKLAVIQKIPTPIKPIKLDSEKGIITLAYFEQKSTVDYIGAVQGIPICFDAKETGQKSLPLQNIHEHQLEFMDNFAHNRGIAFLLVRFSLYDEVYILPFDKLKDMWLNSKKGGRKSIPYSDFNKEWIIKSKNGYLIHYLEGINKILQ